MPVDENKALIEKFYDAFSKRDAETMSTCYHDDVHFTDPAFDLHGTSAADMWRMLCENGKDLKLEYRDVRVEGDKGWAHWDATYTFGATGRKVVNRIDAEFTFKDGLIHRHVDTFDFWAWSKQALGAPGLLLGWSGFLQNKVQQQAAKNLSRYQQKLAR